MQWDMTMPIHTDTATSLTPQPLATPQETPGPAQPPSAGAPGPRDISPIVLEQVLPFLLSSANVQIDKPQRIAEALLKPFQDQAKELLLVLSQSKRLVTASLAAVQEGYLLADTPQAALFTAYRGELLLAIFPVLPTQRYILQTWVDEVYLDRLKLRYQDPRYDRRWKFQVAAAAALYVAPPEFFSLIEQQQVQLTREVMGRVEEIHATGEGGIIDSVTVLPQAAQSYAHPLFEAVTPLSCSLRDISLGGVCLAIEGQAQPEALANQMLQLHLTLPGIASKRHEQARIPIRLCLLGVIRHVNTTHRPWTLHIRFLRRLPGELDMLFEAMERRFLATKRPLE